MISTSIYLENRRKLTLADRVGSHSIQDSAFVGERIDGKTISNSSFEHCTFANISFKEASIKEVKFIDCVFIDCYFRKSDIAGTNFIGCKFIYCKFPKVFVSRCKFDYSTFYDCFIPFKDFEQSLPSEPNLREQLSHNLSVESAKLGFMSQSNQYRKIELKARKKELIAIIRSDLPYYRKKYNDPYQRLKAILELITNYSNTYILGDGTSVWRLIKTLFFLTCFFWVIFMLEKGQFVQLDTNQAPNALTLFWYSLHNILPASFEVKTYAINFTAKILTGVETFLGVIGAALFASYIFRWSINK